MKGVIIGSDLLEHNGDVKFIETNTSDANALESKVAIATPIIPDLKINIAK